jgi:hypothetical protein
MAKRKPDLEAIDQAMAKGRVEQGGPANLGVTVRDYFAAHALVGLCSNFETDDPQQARSLAYLSYKAADAMMTERKR